MAGTISKWRNGTIIHIENFSFDMPGTTPKDKFMILVNIENNRDAGATIIYAMPTSQGHVPARLATNNIACLEDLAACFSAFFIPAHAKCGMSGQPFSKDTHIYYDQNVKQISLNALSVYDANEKITIVDQLSRQVYYDFLKCGANSHRLVRRIKSAFAELLRSDPGTP